MDSRLYRKLTFLCSTGHSPNKSDEILEGNWSIFFFGSSIPGTDLLWPQMSMQKLLLDTENKVRKEVRLRPC